MFIIKFLENWPCYNDDAHKKVSLFVTTSHERRGVSNHQQLCCSFDSLFRLTTKHTPLWGVSPEGYPSQRDVLIWYFLCCQLVMRKAFPYPDVIIMMTTSNGNISRVTDPLCGEFPSQWRGALVSYLICARTNGWVNNRDAGDLRCHWCHCNDAVYLGEVTTFHTHGKDNMRQVWYAMEDRTSILFGVRTCQDAVVLISAQGVWQGHPLIHEHIELWHSIYRVYAMRHVHGCVLICFVNVKSVDFDVSRDSFTHILQSCFIGATRLALWKN